MISPICLSWKISYKNHMKRMAVLVSKQVCIVVLLILETSISPALGVDVA